MTSTEDFLSRTMQEMAAAGDAMFAGNPEPGMALWSQRQPVSLFGAWGPCKTGWDELSQTFRWVGSRFSDGQMTYPVEVARAGADLAYTVGYEVGDVRVDGGPVRPLRIRVTHIYCREDDRWALVHRHADFAPADESPAT
jgi:ketosteroid isomerase-like protein